MSSWAINQNGPITAAEMEGNAQIIKETFLTAGWSLEAIAAILANMEVESGINPGRWENDDVGNLSGGFGLVQWTPATKYLEWSGYAINGDTELERILFEVENEIQYGGVKGEFKEKTFEEWTVSTKKPGYLAAEFMLFYERPLKQGWKEQIDRAKLAEKWYQTISGIVAKRWIPVGLVIVLKKKGVENLVKRSDVI